MNPEKPNTEGAHESEEQRKFPGTLTINDRKGKIIEATAFLLGSDGKKQIQYKVRIEVGPGLYIEKTHDVSLVIKNCGY